MEYSSTGSMRSPFSPRVKASTAGSRSLGLNSGIKNPGKFMHSEQPAGDIIYKTPSFIIETYGAPLPVLVTETLAFASGDVSVRMSSCGWCWLVAGRRVLAWPMETSTPGIPTAARELTLPQTDLAHKADLVMIFYEEEAQMPSCVGVSPEGVVRYWASLAAEGAYTDEACELAGQECDRLEWHHRLPHLLLATTTCTLLTITTDKGGRAAPRCAVLRAAGGWLGGLGRRVSLLFFGAMPAHSDAKLVGLAVLEGSVGEGVEGAEGEEGADAGATVALLASGPLLQLWRGARVQEQHLRRALLDAMARAHLVQGDLNSLEISALDVHAHGPDGLLLLLAASHVARSPDVRHAIAHVALDAAGGARVASLCGVRAPRGPRLLPLPPPAPAPLLLAPTALALAAPPLPAGAEGELELRAEGERLLGAGEAPGGALLFSRRHGLMRLRAAPPAPHPSRSMCESPLDSPCPSDMYEGNLSFYEIDPNEVGGLPADAGGRLKAAFVLHVRRQAGAGRAVAALFPRADPALDRTVLGVVDELLDDAPAGDPRWRSNSGSSRIALGSSAALTVAAQLRDKSRALSLWLEFLQAHGLWSRLTRVPREDGSGSESTVWALCERAARLAGARALHRLAAGDAASLVSGALAAAADDADEMEAAGAGALTAADEGWRRVSRLPRLLAALAELPPPAEARAAAAHALRTLHTINGVLSEMQASARSWLARVTAPPAPAPSTAPAPAATPAHALPERGGPRAPLVAALARLHARALTQTSRRCEASLRAQLHDACAALAELLLLEAEPWQRADARAYCRLRAELLRPYVEEEQIERAAVLAEKFKDFELLVEICVNQNDMQRLNNYIEKYANEGMAETAFGVLWSSGGAGRARLLRGVGGAGAGGGGAARARLCAWLRAPTRRSLLPLLLAPGAAAGVLAGLAAAETASLQRMTTMASMAKLSLLAAETGTAEGAEAEGQDLRRALEERLALGEQHAALPRALRLRHGLEADCRVLDPEDLVQMYVESEGSSLSELDYKRALELTDFVSDMERRDELRLRVWCAAVRCDDWSDVEADAPERELTKKTFFRLMDLVHLMGGDLELLLPAAEDVLTAPELAELVSCPRVRFLIKFGYESLRAPAVR